MATKRQDEAAHDVLATQAYRLGYKSYLDGIKAEECTLHATDLRQAWANGWSDAHDDDKNEKADEQVDVSLGG